METTSLPPSPAVCSNKLKAPKTVYLNLIVPILLRDSGAIEDLLYVHTMRDFMILKLWEVFHGHTSTY